MGPIVSEIICLIKRQATDKRQTDRNGRSSIKIAITLTLGQQKNKKPLHLFTIIIYLIIKKKNKLLKKNQQYS